MKKKIFSFLLTITIISVAMLYTINTTKLNKFESIIGKSNIIIKPLNIDEDNGGHG